LLLHPVLAAKTLIHNHGCHMHTITAVDLDFAVGKGGARKVSAWRRYLSAKRK
jgi:hypothetical protein